jgi:ubiquinone/menaquinone biosynthesis methyltransferase
VAERYDQMNDLLSGGLHRLWKDDLVSLLNPPRSARPFRVLDVAGGTGDVAFRILRTGGSGTEVVVADISPAMIAEGCKRARQEQLTERCRFAAPMPKRCRSPTAASMPIRWPSASATSPTSTAALVEAYRVLKPGGRFVCLEFSTVDVPGLDALYDAYSFAVMPAVGQVVTGDGAAYRYLAESIRTFPCAEEFASMIAQSGFPGCACASSPAASWPSIRPGGSRLGGRMFKSAGHIFRLMRAGRVLARHQALLPHEELGDLPQPARLALRILSLGRPQKGVSEGASPLVSALTELGPSYIKLGQFFATRPDIIGVQWAGKLAELQDNLAPFDHRAAQAEVETGLGAPLTSLFAEFGPPVAAASIAQVHKAKLSQARLSQADAPMREVAVKVLRPNIERRFQADLDSFFFAARLIERWHPPSRRLRPVDAVATLAQSVKLEMDLRMEAAAISEMTENTRDDPGIRLPAVDWQRTARRVLTTDSMLRRSPTA